MFVVRRKASLPLGYVGGRQPIRLLFGFWSKPSQSEPSQSEAPNQPQQPQESQGERSTAAGGNLAAEVPAPPGGSSVNSMRKAVWSPGSPSHRFQPGGSRRIATPPYTGNQRAAFDELDRLVLDPVKAWGSPSLWDQLLAQHGTAGSQIPAVEPAEARMAKQALDKRLCQELPLPEREGLMSLQAHARFLLGCNIPGVDMRAEAGKAAEYASSHMATNRYAAISAVYSRLAQLHVGWLAQAARHVAPNCSPQLARAIVSYLVGHGDHLIDVAAEAEHIMRINPEIPGHQAEVFLLAAVGPWLEAASIALTLLPEAPQYPRNDLHELTTLWARYLVSKSRLSDKAVISSFGMHEKVHAAMDPTHYMELPASDSDAALLGQMAPLFGPPTTEADVGSLVTCIATAALVPLTTYAEAQLLLASTAARCDVVLPKQGSGNFVRALQKHVAWQCLLFAEARLPRKEAQLAYRALVHLCQLEAIAVPHEEKPTPGSGGVVDMLSGLFKPRQAAKPASRDDVITHATTLCTIVKVVNPGELLQSQDGWEMVVPLLFDRVTRELQEGRAAQAETLVQESAALLQEANLVTLILQPPTWDALHGPALVQAAVRANASGLLSALQQALAGGPYAQAAPWPYLGLQCHQAAGRVAELVALVEEDAAGSPNQGPQLPWESETLWHELGNACALMAAPGQDPALLPRLWMALARLPAAKCASPNTYVPLVAQRALERVRERPDAVDLLPALHRSLAALPAPGESVGKVFKAMLAAGLVEEAVLQLGQLAAGRLQEDAQLLNRVYSRLLEDAFFADSADEASKLPVSHPAMQGPQFLECTQLVEGWLRQLGERPLPLSQRAAEALAAVRMLGLEQYKQGWNALQNTADTWQQPISPHALLLVLRGLALQLHNAHASGATIVGTTRRIVADLAAGAQAPDSPTGQPTMPARRTPSSSATTAAAAPQPARWPPLDASLSVALLQLLKACHTALADQAKTLGPSPLASGVQALMWALSAGQLPLTSELCYHLWEALLCDDKLLEWAETRFQGEGSSEFGVLAALEAVAGNSSAGQLVLQLRPSP